MKLKFFLCAISIIAFSTAIVIGFTMVSGQAQALQSASAPSFFGTVTVDGGQVSQPSVRAIMNGNDCTGEQLPVPPGSGSSSYNIAVVSADSLPGCGTSGASITFTVNGRAANERGTWQPITPPDPIGRRLDLTVGSASSGSPSPAAPSATPQSATAIPRSATAVPQSGIQPPPTGSGGLR
jgi:hypothetical protein